MPKPEPTYQKLRGGYYTPAPIADFMARWAIISPQARILEPSCGDGVFIEASLKALQERGATRQKAASLVSAVELDEQERSKALDRANALGYPLKPTNVQQGDFFSYCHRNLGKTGLFSQFESTAVQTFDAVLGNPPFIRYQNFAEEHRQPAFEILQRAGIKPSRLTNSWVPFVVASAFMLNQHGRLAMVIPAELLQVNYAAELRRFLSDYFNKITLVTFRKLVFAGIQQEVVLLLAERNGGGKGGIRAIELTDQSELAAYEHTDFTNRELKPLDHSKEKWTQYFLSKKEIELLRTLLLTPELTPAAQVLEVDVGIVTGQNQFFVLNEEQLQRLALRRYGKRLVGRSGHFNGILFQETHWQQNAAQNLPAYLLDLPDKPLSELSQAINNYVSFGETSEFNTGFKCRIRPRWYVVPSVWTPDAFMLRQVHTYPKLILNQAEATCTDTIHRVRFKQGVNGEQVTASFLNSLTFAFSEVMGRSYGGGVLELEPNEAEKLPLPLKLAEKLSAKETDQLLTQHDIEAVLQQNDEVLLRDGLGLDTRDMRMLRGIWEKLRDRRIHRKHLIKHAGLSKGSDTKLAAKSRAASR